MWFFYNFFYRKVAGHSVAHRKFSDLSLKITLVAITSGAQGLGDTSDQCDSCKNGRWNQVLIILFCFHGIISIFQGPESLGPHWATAQLSHVNPDLWADFSAFSDTCTSISLEKPQSQPAVSINPTILFFFFLGRHQHCDPNTGTNLIRLTLPELSSCMVQLLFTGGKLEADGIVRGLPSSVMSYRIWQEWSRA